MAARRVLVIEDDAGARNGLLSLLAEDGYTVRTAPTGEGGVECAREFRPDVVVCDYTLPGINGLQVLRRLREMPWHMLFIVLTAGCGDEKVERTLRAESDVFLRKPVDLTQFRALLGAPGETAAPAKAFN